MGAIGTVHFAYGFGSLWTSTGDWDAAGSKDSKGRDGCGDRSESFGEGECGFAAVCGEWAGPVRRVGRQGDAVGSAGAADGAGIEGRQQTVWHGGGQAAGEAVHGALAGGNRGLFWVVRDGRGWGGVEVAGGDSCDGYES